MNGKKAVNVEGDDSKTMPMERIERLVNLGMGTMEEGPYKSRGNHMRGMKQWEEGFQELIQFKDHGHVNVSRSKHKDTHWKLAVWVSTQRVAFQNRHSKDPSKKPFMTDEQMTKLAGVGFRFKLQNDWEKRFAQLVEYKAKFGHTRVPVAYERHDKLGKWVAHIKNMYHQNKLPQDRRAKLNALEFDWSLRSGPDRNNNSM